MMNQVIYIYLLYSIEFFAMALSSETNGCVVEKVDAKHSRQERALLFPPSSTIGVSEFSAFFANKIINQSEIKKNQF